jgi:hypothetical protein
VQVLALLDINVIPTSVAVGGVEPASRDQANRMHGLVAVADNMHHPAIINSFLFNRGIGVL